MRSTALTPFQRLALTVGGLGTLKPASGTWGSLPPVILLFVMLKLVSWLDSATWPIGWLLVLTMLLVCAAATFACLVFGDRGEIAWGRKDPSQNVADEVAGMSLTIALCWAAVLLFEPAWGFSVVLKAAAGYTNWLVLLVLFLSFRAFDILKLWPCNRLQKQPGGLGIVLDDLVAAVQAAICAFAAMWLIYKVT